MERGINERISSSERFDIDMLITATCCLLDFLICVVRNPPCSFGNDTELVSLLDGEA